MLVSLLITACLSLTGLISLGAVVVLGLVELVFWCCVIRAKYFEKGVDSIS
jgi:hypothetical protein